MYFCIQRYLHYKSKVIITMKESKKETFMAFTICPSYQAAYKADVLSNYGSNIGEYRRGNFTINQSRNAFEIFKEVTYNFTEVIEEVLIQTSNLTTPKIFLNDKTHWTENYQFNFGRCYSLQIPDNITSLGITGVSITANMETYIYLHHPGQFLEVGSTSKLYTKSGKIGKINPNHNF